MAMELKHYNSVQKSISKGAFKDTPLFIEENVQFSLCSDDIE